MNGILLADKPAGWTSFDVVNRVRRLVQGSPLNTSPKKRFPVGHTGTLDPLATGLLVLLLGDYTKRAPELTKMDKTYEATLRLGQVSSTGDEEGEKREVLAQQPTRGALEAALKQFEGQIMQTPPTFSAIKINGQRAYKLARAGKTPELKPRPATIHRLQLTGYDYPFATLIADVSSGTYIRTLAEDIGRALGTGAYLSALRRTRVGPFDLTNATTLFDLTAETISKKLSSV